MGIQRDIWKPYENEWRVHLDKKRKVNKIIKEGMYKNSGNSSSANTDIFNGKLKKLKQFCVYFFLS